MSRNVRPESLSPPIQRRRRPQWLGRPHGILAVVVSVFFCACAFTSEGAGTPSLDAAIEPDDDAAAVDSEPTPPVDAVTESLPPEADAPDPCANQPPAPPPGNIPTPDPNRYHWNGSQHPFFEGWYYKVKDPTSGHSFFFIYGVQNPGAPQAPGSGGFLYVQRDDGDFQFAPVPVDRFSASTTECLVAVDQAHATESHLDGTIGSGPDAISWDLDVSIFSEWGYTMGSLTNTPNIPVNWYVNAINSRVCGRISWRGTEYLLTDAPGYNDHNWGPSFPEAWLWSQANGFENPTEAVAFAGGPLPTGLVDPNGYMLVYAYDDVFLEFRTQDLTAIFLVTHDQPSGSLRVTATKGTFRVVYTVASAPYDQRTVLVPTAGGMVPGGSETFSGIFTVELYRQDLLSWTLIRKSSSAVGVLEFGGSYGGY